VRRSRGFTLIELLVVIAIIGVLVGLLLPAVQKVREAANRIKCTNNLKQLALAAMTFENTYSLLPPGDAYVGGNGTWLHYVLPYVEQQNLFNLYVNLGGNPYGLGGPNYTASTYNGQPIGNLQVAETALPITTCPSDAGAGLTKPPGRNGQPFGFGNYACNFGNTMRTQNKAGRDPFLPAIRPVFAGAPFTYGQTAGRPNQQTLASITDGTSNTLLLSEILQGISALPNITEFRGFQWYGPGSEFTTWTTPNSPNADYMQFQNYCDNLPLQNLPCQFGRDWALAARSRHPGGVNAALSDGSVHFYTNAIDPTTWSLLGSSQDGLPLPTSP
jgi:prepilin-type N-terminal cleavage/methylation domain-containing protein/prepilin-type processing-associated H-X9-DG protein